MSPIGWLHAVFAVIALASGALNIARRKGTPTHRWTGRVFALSMLGLNGAALFIYRLTGRFEFFHGLALLSLVTLAIGVVPVLARRPRRAWLDLHYFAIGMAYAGLVAAFVNELLARVPFLAPLTGAGPLTPARLHRIFAIGGSLGQIATELMLALLIWRHDAAMAPLRGRAPSAPTAPGGFAALREILIFLGVAAIVRALGGAVPALASGLGLPVVLGVLVLAYRPRAAMQELRWLAAYFFLLAFADFWSMLEPAAVLLLRPSAATFGLVALGLFLDGGLVVLGFAGLMLALCAYGFAAAWAGPAIGVVLGATEIAAGWRLTRSLAMDRAVPRIEARALP